MYMHSSVLKSHYLTQRIKCETNKERQISYAVGG